MQSERRALYPVAEEDAAERFRDVDGVALGFAEAEGMVVVVEGEDGAHGVVALGGGGGEVVDVQLDQVALSVVGWCEAGEVEGGCELAGED